MKCTNYDMNAYNLHIVNTDKFKTITIGVAFRRKVLKEEITMRNLLKEIMINSTANYPSEKSLVIATEELYDLKLQAANYRIGNYSIMSFKTRFLNEKYTEENMNEESIKFFLDLIFNPKLDNDVDKCKKKIEKSILLLHDNKIKYVLTKLLETTGDKPYSYNSFGNIDDLNSIREEDIKKYYSSMIKDDIVDVFVVGEVDEIFIKNVFKEYFKLVTFHKDNVDLIVDELSPSKKVLEYSEKDNVNQTQLTVLCDIHNLTDFERKYVLPMYTEMLGGASNSILFDAVREKNSYAYYVNAVSKSYDNIMMIYAGIQPGNEDAVFKIMCKALKDVTKGNFPDDKFNGARELLVSSIKAGLDNPVGIINNEYANILVGSPDANTRIENFKKVTREDIVCVSKKINVHSRFILEGNNEKNND